MSRWSQVQVIIPAFNEEETVGVVVESLRAMGLERIRVVDNGSRDATARAAGRAGAEVVAEPKRGYGQACWTGCHGLPAEVRWLVFIDADGSDRCADVARLLEAAEAGADFVLGDRRSRADARQALTPAQRWGNAFATLLVSWVWGHRYRDLGPLRVIRRTLFERMEMTDRGFGWTLEMQVRAIELGAKVLELPVDYGRRRGGQSKISGTISGSVRAGAIILTTLARLAVRRVRRRR